MDELKATVRVQNVEIVSLQTSLTKMSKCKNALTRVASEKIYLFESLTSYRKKIVNRANEMRNDGLILSVWTMDGKIFVKTSPEGRPIRICELEDLEYL